MHSGYHTKRWYVMIELTYPPTTPTVHVSTTETMQTWTFSLALSLTDVCNDIILNTLKQRVCMPVYVFVHFHFFFVSLWCCIFMVFFKCQYCIFTACNCLSPEIIVMVSDKIDLRPVSWERVTNRRTVCCSSLPAGSMIVSWEVLLKEYNWMHIYSTCQKRRHHRLSPAGKIF